MTQPQFEQAVLKLWVSSRVPMTRVNLQVYTGVARAKMDRWLDQMVANDTLEVDSDDSGELTWIVRGAERPRGGLEQIAEVQKLEALRGSLPSAPESAARAIVRVASELATPQARTDGKHAKKSLIASGALSFFLGPIGWIYAAPLKEALPASVIYLLIVTLLPNFLLLWLMGIAAPISALFGVLYAWHHNMSGGRASLIDSARKRLR